MTIMCDRRALVECVVLSLQDACVFYPCCKGCFSRIDVEQQDTTRCRCSRCGYSCMRELVDYRYRLSLRVVRDGCMFGVTVFGTCLNPYFGIHASGLQRLVENVDGTVGASARSTLLLEAVKDCFIGRHFIFGIKVTETESRPWLGRPVANVSSTKETVHVIATQMILPKAGLGGCTVVSYYRILLQKAAEYEQGSTDSSKTRPPPATMLLIPCHSSASSFNNGTLCSSGLLSQSLLRSQHQDCTLTFTPPWEQSLGLVTSSAEQEEGCSTQDSGDEKSRRTDNFKTPHHAQRGCQEDHKITEETGLTPLLSLEGSSYNCPSFAKYPLSSIEKADGNTPILSTWFSPSPPCQNSSKARGSATKQLNETFLPSSVAWEDLPFSESLTEFLCEKNKYFDIVSKNEQLLNVQNQKETARNNMEIRSQDKNISIQSTACQSNTQITDRHSRILMDIINTPAQFGGDGHDLSDQVCKSPAAGCVNKNQARNISHECNQRDEKVSLLSFENEEEEQLDGDTYNCSSDLFSSSLAFDIITDTLSKPAESVRTTSDACTVLSKPDSQHLRSEKANVPQSTPHKQKLENKKRINRDSLIPPGTQELDFIPPSQSTPIVKVAVVSGSPASSYRTLTLGECSSQPDSQDSYVCCINLPKLDSKKQASITSSKLNCVCANQLCQCGRVPAEDKLVWSVTSSRHRHRITPKRRFWKPEKYQNYLLAQHLRGQRGALNKDSTGRITCDSSDCGVTVCDYEDGEEMIVPPTPAAKTRQSVKLRRRMQTDNVGHTWEEQKGDGVNCKRTLLDQTPSLSQRDLAQTGNCDSETADQNNLDESNHYLPGDENEACDWSRDLFSDSL